MGHFHLKMTINQWDIFTKKSNLYLEKTRTFLLKNELKKRDIFT